MYYDISDKFIDRFDWLLSSHGFSHETFAKEMKVSLQTVRNWAYGDRLPSFKQIASICRRFDVSADHLLCLTNMPDPQLPSSVLSEATAERLQRMTPEALALVSELIRYISAADGSHNLRDEYYLSDSFLFRNGYSTRIPNYKKDSFSDLEPEQRDIIEHTLKTFREANAAKAQEA